MKARILFLAIVMLTFLLPGAVMAQQFFDYFGMTLLPNGVGDSLTMYAEVRDPAPAVAPLPLDYDNYQYTLVITDLELVADGFPEIYANGTITLYEDNGTTADYASPATFTDGTAILVGAVSMEVYHLSNVIPTNTTGNGTGTVDWIGGTNLNDFAPEDQLGWTFLVATNSGSGLLEPGYDEVWDGKVEPQDIIVSTDRVTWDKLKAYLK